MSQNPTAGGGDTVRIPIDPVTRIEGHLKIEVEVKDGVVVDARCYGGMYRGIEQILRGRDPRDSSQIVQRICGVCPTAHCTASILAQDAAFGVKTPTNGRMIRNLTFASNYLQSHILHFYHLAALDYVKGPDVAPFVPRYANADLITDRIKDKAKAEAVNKTGVDQYLKALEMRRICHEMVAMFGGRMPHVQGLVGGGATQIPTAERLADYAVRFKEVKKFIAEEYIPLVYTVGSVYLDLFATGVGYKNVISFGVFPLDDEGKTSLHKPGVYIDGKDEPFDPKQIKEYVKYSFFDYSKPGGLHYSEGETNPNPDKAGAYSFVKAPRYKDKPCEAGPLARMWITNPPLSPMGQKLLKERYSIEAKNFRDLGDKAFSIMGRHVARAEEAYLVAQAIEGWLREIKPEAETYAKPEIPDTGEGTGFTEAPRGALLHYLKIKDKKIDNYQVVSATLWNCNPRDDMGQRGPVEQALIGVPVPDIKNPVNVGRLIRAFDP